MKLHIGVTGTQRGMTFRQKGVWRLFLNKIGNLWQITSGQCIGADAEFIEIARSVYPNVCVISRPGNNREKTSDAPATFTYPVRPNLDRNKQIVMACDLLVAAPRTAEEELRSGTWATIRHARKVGRPVLFLWP